MFQVPNLCYKNGHIDNKKRRLVKDMICFYKNCKEKGFVCPICIENENHKLHPYCYFPTITIANKLRSELDKFQQSRNEYKENLQQLKKKCDVLLDGLDKNLEKFDFFESLAANIENLEFENKEKMLNVERVLDDLVGCDGGPCNLNFSKLQEIMNEKTKALIEKENLFEIDLLCKNGIEEKSRKQSG